MKVEIVRKKVKNFNLRVRRDGTVCLSVPFFVEEKAAQTYLEKHMGWIEKNVQKVLEVKDLSNDHFYYLGEPYKVISLEGDGQKVELAEGHLYVTKGKNTVHEIIKDWMKKEAVSVFTPLLEEGKEKMPFSVNPILKVRMMISRWGSAHLGKNTVTLNIRLLHYPKSVISYVIIHELLHFRYPHHQKTFYQALESIIPFWKEEKALLKSHLNWIFQEKDGSSLRIV